MLAFHITLNEFRRIWIQPLVWAVLGITFIIIALLFLTLLNNFYHDMQNKFSGIASAPGVTDAVFYPMLFWSTIIGALMMPIITLRTVTEEKIRRQDTLLTCAAIPCHTIIYSKLMAIISVAFAFGFLNLIFPATISAMTNLDWGKIYAAMLGMLLFQISFASVCLWIATLTHNIMFIMLSSLGTLFLSFILFFSATSEGSISALFLYLSGFSHLLNFLSGLVTSKGILFFIITTLFFVSLSTIHLRYKRD